MFVFLFDIRLPNKWIAFHKGSPAARVFSNKGNKFRKIAQEVDKTQNEASEGCP